MLDLEGINHAVPTFKETPNIMWRYILYYTSFRKISAVSQSLFETPRWQKWINERPCPQAVFSLVDAYNVKSE